MTEENVSCPCRRQDCERHGNCEMCCEHHKMKGTFTACERIKQKALRKE